MHTVASRELRNETRQVLDRVRDGEEVVITVNGRPVARISAVEARDTWTPRHRFLARLVQADSGLRDDLDRLAPDTTDDLPLR